MLEKEDLGSKNMPSATPAMTINAKTDVFHVHTSLSNGVIRKRHFETV